MIVQVREGWVEMLDHHKLFYSVRGEGQPIIFCNGIGVSTLSFWKEVVRDLARRYQVIQWDYLGHGRSDPPSDSSAMSIRLCARQLICLMDHLNIHKAVIAGYSMGVQVILEFWRLCADRVLGLIPMLGAFERPFTNLMRSSHSGEIFEYLYEFAMKNPKVIKKLWPYILACVWTIPFVRWSSRLYGHWGGYLVNPTLCTDDEMDLYLSHLRSMCPKTFLSLARSMQDHSARDLLSQIDVPTLIIAGESDILTPFETSLEMYKLIQNAEMEVILGGSHAAPAERPECFWKSIDRFMQKYFSDQSKITKDQVTGREPSDHLDQPCIVVGGNPISIIKNI
jgi:pimeloyl-ACP methyl ester carboxylesterase